MSRKIIVGQITSPHGIQGAVKVRSFTEDPTTLFSFSVLRYGADTFFTHWKQRQIEGQQFIVHFQGVINRTQSDSLRNVFLWVFRNELPPLASDEWYHSDLIGLNVQNLQGQNVGKVKEVCSFGAGDLLEVEDAKGETFFIPFSCVNVHLEQETVIWNSPESL